MTTEMWKMSPEEAGPRAIMNGEEVVMYLDDIPEQIAVKVIVLHNEGKSIEEINAHLEQDNGCFTDQREFIIEQITAYANLTSGEQPPLPVPQPPAQQPEKPMSQQQRAAITRKKNAAAKAEQAGKGATAAPKKLTTKDAIKEMEDKIALLKTLDAAPALEIPQGLGKTGRDLMIEFQKEQDALVQKYIGRIQKM